MKHAMVNTNLLPHHLKSHNTVFFIRG